MERVVDVPLKDLKKPGNWKDLVKSDHVKTLAESIASNGLIEPVILRKDKSFVAGRRRAAAHEVLKRGTVPAIIRDEESDLRAQLQTVAENLHREHMTAEQRGDALKEYVVLTEKLIAEEEANTPEEVAWGKPKKGRPKSTKRKAIERVAKDTGKSPSTVARAVAEPSESGPSLPSDFETYGLELDASETIRVLAVVNAHKVAVRTLREAQAAIKGIVIAGGESAHADALERELDNVIAQAVKAVPVSLCPPCKMLAGYVEKCHLCGGVGVVGKSKLQAQPPELLAKGKKAVVQGPRGKFIPVGE